MTEKIREATGKFIREEQLKGKYTVRNGKQVIHIQSKPNLSRAERECMLKLKSNNDIVIKSADKGGATVIMNRANYVAEALAQLNNQQYYEEIDEPVYMSNVGKIDAILNRMKVEKYITDKQLEYLSGPAEVKPRTFYLLPKIHKKVETWPQPNKMPAGRPIVSDVGSETYRISEYIDSFINPLATRHATYIKNTYDFISKITDFNLDQEYVLVTGDITSLYTNMLIDRTVDCVRKAFADNPANDRPDDYIIQLLEIALKNNDFEFDGKFYLQIMGTAMGKRFAPALANLYLLDFDRGAKANFEIKPKLFFRFLDDVFFLFPKNQAHRLSDYEAFLNSLIPNIKITLEHNNNSINFLDTTIFIRNNRLCTKTYFKETDTHQLLHKQSHHPKHTFKGIIKSQLIRYKRLSTFKEDYFNTCNILFTYLKNRGYTYAEIRKFKYDIWYNYDNNVQTARKKNDKELLPITMDYTVISHELAKECRRILIEQDVLKNIQPIIAYRNDRNLKQILTRSKLTSIAQGTFATCGNRKCRTCLVHATNTRTFTSNRYKTRYNVQNDLTCNSSNIIYLIECRQCGKQYVGETGRTLRDRLNNHRSAILHKKNTSIALHFNSNGHSILDLKITAIEQRERIDRRNREIYWQNILGTWEPWGINGMNDHAMD